MSISQLPQRQIHLAIANFEKLNVNKFSHLEELKYDENGRPIARWVSKTAGWAKQAHVIQDLLADEVIPALQGTVGKLVECTRQAQPIISSGATLTDKLEASENLIGLVTQCNRVLSLAQKELVHLSPRSLEEYKAFLQKELERVSELEEI